MPVVGVAYVPLFRFHCVSVDCVVVAPLCVSKLKLCSLLLNEAHFCICMCVFAIRSVRVFVYTYT